MKSKKNVKQAENADAANYRKKINEPLAKLSVAVIEVIDDLFHKPDKAQFEPELDMFESDDMIVMEVALPGIDPDDLKLRVDPTSLSFQGEVLASDDFDEDEVYISERFYGPFKRKIEIPFPVNPSMTEAFYLDGVLRVEMPLIENDDDKEYPGMDIQVM